MARYVRFELRKFNGCYAGRMHVRANDLWSVPLYLRCRISLPFSARWKNFAPSPIHLSLSLSPFHCFVSRLVHSPGRRYIFDYIGKMSVSMAQDGRKGKFGRKNCIVLPGRKGGGKEKKNGKERRKRRKADELQSIHRIIQIPWSMGKESLSPSPCCVEWNKRRYSDHIRIRAYNAQGLSPSLSWEREAESL